MDADSNKIVKLILKRDQKILDFNDFQKQNIKFDILKLQGYDISDYETFSINEIDAMLNNNQLDMLIENPDSKQKSYIKYYSSK